MSDDRAGEPLQATHSELQQQLIAAELDFINTELDLAITFCRMALTRENQENAQRHAANGIRAYEAASHRMKDRWLKNWLEDDSNSEISKKSEEVRKLIERVKASRHSSQ
jgi:hypothetical protein